MFFVCQIRIMNQCSDSWILYFSCPINNFVKRSFLYKRPIFLQVCIYSFHINEVLEEFKIITIFAEISAEIIWAVFLLAVIRLRLKSSINKKFMLKIQFSFWVTWTCVDELLTIFETSHAPHTWLPILSSGTRPSGWVIRKNYDNISSSMQFVRIFELKFGISRPRTCKVKYLKCTAALSCSNSVNL
jgi:hypothetical protein